MQVQNNSQLTNTNFRAIKSLKCAGLYKNFPEQGTKLVSTFQKNKVAMDFCRKYDVDIVFKAVRKVLDDAESTIQIFFNNPAKRKFLGIFGSKRDEVRLSTYAREHDTKSALECSTTRLDYYITESIGVLNTHLKLKDKEIQETLSRNDNRCIKEHLEKTKFAKETKELDDAIKELINKSK